MKRAAVVSIVLLAAVWPGPIAGLGLGASAAQAQTDQSWNGTWAGGWTGNSGTQITFAGDDFISIYWRDDYIENATGVVSAGGAKATIRWSRGEAVLTRESATSARVTVREQGRPAVSFALKKD